MFKKITYFLYRFEIARGSQYVLNMEHELLPRLRSVISLTRGLTFIPHICPKGCRLRTSYGHTLADISLVYFEIRSTWGLKDELCSVPCPIRADPNAFNQHWGNR